MTGKVAFICTDFQHVTLFYLRESQSLWLSSFPTRLSFVFSCARHNSIRCLAFCRAFDYEEPLNIKTKIGKSTPDCLSFHFSRPLLRSHWSVPLPSSLWFPWECPPQRHATTAWTTSFALQRKQRAQILDTSKTPSQVFIYYCTKKTFAFNRNYSGGMLICTKVECHLFCIQGLCLTLGVTLCLACQPTAPAAV